MQKNIRFITFHIVVLGEREIRSWYYYKKHSMHVCCHNVLAMTKYLFSTPGFFRRNKCFCIIYEKLHIKTLLIYILILFLEMFNLHKKPDKIKPATGFMVCRASRGCDGMRLHYWCYLITFRNFKKKTTTNKCVLLNYMYYTLQLIHFRLLTFIFNGLNDQC